MSPTHVPVVIKNCHYALDVLPFSSRAHVPVELQRLLTSIQLKAPPLPCPSMCIFKTFTYIGSTKYFSNNRWISKFVLLLYTSMLSVLSLRLSPKKERTCLHSHLLSKCTFCLLRCQPPAPCNAEAASPLEHPCKRSLTGRFLFVSFAAA